MVVRRVKRAPLHVRRDEEPDWDDLNDWQSYHHFGGCVFCGRDDHRERCPHKP